MTIQLSDWGKADAAASTLGHEAFVHGQKSIEKINDVFNTTSIKPGDKSYIQKVQKIVDADSDHKMLGNGQSVQYQNFSAQRYKIQKNNFYIQQYEKDVNNHKK